MNEKIKSEGKCKYFADVGVPFLSIGGIPLYHQITLTIPKADVGLIAQHPKPPQINHQQ